MPGGKRVSTGIHFLVNIGKFRLSNFQDQNLQRILLTLHRLTKFGTINRFMEMKFCFTWHRRKGPLANNIQI